jgi:hypothetical protein
MDVSREPAQAVGVVAAIVALLVAYRVLDVATAEAWKALAIIAVPLLQAHVTRRFVMPTATVRKGGADPEALVARAALDRAP